MSSGGQRKQGECLQLFGGGEWGVFWFLLGLCVCVSFLDCKSNLLCNFSPFLKHSIWAISEVHFLGVEATFPGCFTFYTPETRYSYPFNTSNRTFQIKWPTLTQFYWIFFFPSLSIRRGRGKRWLIYCVCSLVFQIYLKRWGPVFTDTSPLLPPAHEKKRWFSKKSEQPIKKRWLLLAWLSGSFSLSLLMTLSLQVTQHHRTVL